MGRRWPIKNDLILTGRLSWQKAPHARRHRSVLPRRGRGSKHDGGCRRGGRAPRLYHCRLRVRRGCAAHLPRVRGRRGPGLQAPASRDAGDGRIAGPASARIRSLDSPVAVAARDLRSRDLVQRISAGTQGVVAALHATRLSCASLVNASATARAVLYAPDIDRFDFAMEVTRVAEGLRLAPVPAPITG